MAAIRLKVLFFLIILSCINLNKALETLDEGECGPCVVEECQPIPNDCKTEITVDKCGCCRVCNEVLQPALEYFSLLPRYSRVKESFTRRYSESPPTLSYETSVNPLTFNAFNEMQMFPIDTDNILQKSLIIQKRHNPIVLHFSEPGIQLLSLLRNIRKRRTHYNNYMIPNFSPSCRFYRHFAMKPKFHHDNNNNQILQNINEPYQNGNYKRNVFTATRFRVIPLRIILKKIKLRPLNASPFAKDNSDSLPDALHLHSYGLDGNRPNIIIRPRYYNDDPRSQLRSQIRKTIRNIFKLMILAHSQDLKRRQSFYRIGNEPYPMDSYYSYTVYRPKREHRKKQKHNGRFIDTPRFGMKQIEENVLDFHNPVPFNDNYKGFTRVNLPTYIMKKWKIPGRKIAIKNIETNINERRSKPIPKSSENKIFSEKAVAEERHHVTSENSKGIVDERFGFWFNGKFDKLRDVAGKQKHNLRRHHISRRSKLYKEDPELSTNGDAQYLDNVDGPFRNKHARLNFASRAIESSLDEIPFNGNGRVTSPFMPQEKYMRNKATLKLLWEKRDLQERIDKLALEANLKAQKIMKQMKKNPTKTFLSVIETFREYVRRIGEELGQHE
ncbi:hypothetical protein C0J52_24027 [Blattella germanica]|nr:hypothetical protein C0J52_24027 [Blattella germanica]